MVQNRSKSQKKERVRERRRKKREGPGKKKIAPQNAEPPERRSLGKKNSGTKEGGGKNPVKNPHGFEQKKKVLLIN